MTEATPSLLQPDRQLVLDARLGDRDAFSILVVRYERSVLAIAVGILRSPQDARDSAQEAFILAYRALNQLAAPERFAPWLFQITRRCSLRLRRRRSRNPSVGLSPDFPSHRVEPGASKLSQELLDLIARLPDSERVVVLLRHVDNMRVHEIAQVTGRPTGTVTKQLSRAYERLRKKLTSEVRDA